MPFVVDLPSRVGLCTTYLFGIVMSLRRDKTLLVKTMTDDLSCLGF